MIEIGSTRKRLFESDPAAPDYQETAPAYELHAALGWPTWWPPLFAVWASEDPPADQPTTGMARDWHKARAELMSLHAEYLANAQG